MVRISPGRSIGELGNFYTNELIDPINDFDVRKIQAQALAFKK